MAEILEFAIFVTYRPDPAHLFPYRCILTNTRHTIWHGIRRFFIGDGWRLHLPSPCFVRGSRPTSPYFFAKIIVFGWLVGGHRSLKTSFLRKKNYFFSLFLSLSPQEILTSFKRPLMNSVRYPLRFSSIQTLNVKCYLSEIKGWNMFVWKKNFENL